MAGDYVFRYDGIEPSRCVSLTMPPRRPDYFQRELHPLFQMNLPEGYLLEQLKFRLAKLVKVDPMLTLLHQQALVERAPEVAQAIRKSAQPFEMTFG